MPPRKDKMWEQAIENMVGAMNVIIDRIQWAPDRKDLRRVRDKIRHQKLGEAYELMAGLDTVVREQIPDPLYTLLCRIADLARWDYLPSELDPSQWCRCNQWKNHCVSLPRASIEAMRSCPFCHYTFTKSKGI